MSSPQTTLMYSFLALCILVISLYSMYLFGISHAIFFIDTDLLIPFTQNIDLPYKAWNLPSHFLVIPDACIYYLCSLVTESPKEAIVLYTIIIVLFIYLILVCTVERRPHEPTLSLYLLLWIMLLLLYFSTTPFLARIFLPNGLLGFMCLYYITTYTIYTILYTKDPSCTKLVLFCTSLLLAFTTPFLAFVLIGIPSLLLSFMQRRFTYPSERYFQFDLIITISITIGFLLQFYIFPSKQTFALSTIQDAFSALVTHVHSLLLCFSALGLCYTFVYSFSNKQGSTLLTMRIASLGIILGIIASTLGIIDATLYLLFVLLFTLIYALPHCIIALTSLLTMSKKYSINIVFCLSTLLSISLLYYTYNTPQEVIPSQELIMYLDSSLPQNSPHYVFVPQNIATELTLFSKREIIAIPYDIHTLEYASFTPNDETQYHYSALIIEKHSEETLLIQQLLSLIGEPTHKEIVGNYIVMEYKDGFTMPNAGKLATYTTPLGNIIRNSLDKAILIPQPDTFTVDGIPIKEIRLLRDESKSFIALVFDKDTPLPTDTDYTVYTLSPSSSALRKLASGIRRELPFLSSLLPLEDKNTEYITNTKELYIVQNGDMVVAINITDHVTDTLTFLSISIQDSKPAIVFQYPTEPITFTNE